MEAVKETTGVLRADIELLRGEELLLFDPGSDAYFKVSQRTIQIISYFISFNLKPRINILIRETICIYT